MEFPVNIINWHTNRELPFGATAHWILAFGDGQRLTRRSDDCVTSNTALKLTYL